MTPPAQPCSERIQHAATPCCQYDAIDWCVRHGSRPAWGMCEKEEIDETDACELGSQAALDQIRREREAERG